MSDLFPRLRPIERETLPSFLSRLATSKGVRTTDLALDMGVSFKRLINQEKDALKRLADWSRLTDEELRDLQSWTGTAGGNVTTLFRNEIFGSRALRHPTIRGCPLCLREDVIGHEDEPLTGMAMRGHWQLRGVTTCLHHHHPLIALWQDEGLLARMNIQEQLAGILDRILDGSLVEPRQDPSDFDHWLDHRLATGEDPTWLSGQSLYAATIFCRLLGGEMLRPEGTHHQTSVVELRAAQTAGFERARQGEAAIRESLEALAARADRRLGAAPTAFGVLFIKLADAYRDLPEFDTFRDILRDVILSVWPIASGETVLGQVVAERRLHSVITAAQEAGIGAGAMDQLLTDAGVFSRDDDRPRRRKTFPAEEHKALLANAATLVTASELAAAMGATTKEVSALRRAGILTPRIGRAEISSKWQISDGIALVAEMDALAAMLTEDNPGWIALNAASSRTQQPVGKIIEAIRAGELQVARPKGTKGYSTLMVNEAEILAWHGNRLNQAKQRTSIVRDTMSCAEFARLIGVRDGRLFLAFINAGYGQATEETHPFTRQVQARMTIAQIESFHAKFGTLTTLAQETGLHRNAILARLRAACVEKFAPGGQDFGAIYLREDVLPALKPSERPKLRRDRDSSED